jgi:hypothetical protein
MDLIFSPNEVAGVVLNQHISVKAAAECSGYSIQYLRRLLRNGYLEGTKIGQVWLIEMASFDCYLRNGHMRRDRRCGPRKPKAIRSSEVAS